MLPKVCINPDPASNEEQVIAEPVILLVIIEEQVNWPLLLNDHAPLAKYPKSPPLLKYQYPFPEVVSPVLKIWNISPETADGNIVTRLIPADF